MKPHQNNEPKKFPLLLILFVCVVAAVCAYVFLPHPSIKLQPPKLLTNTNTYRVLKTYDGDTIEVDMDGKPEKVRLIGVDTPETHDPRKAVQCYGLAASEFTKKLLTNKSVRLESDQLSTNRDRYDRLLRYVYVDSTLVNAELIKQGYGFAYTGFPFTKSKDFVDLQKQAEAQKYGLWGSCQVNTKENGQKQTNDN